MTELTVIILTCNEALHIARAIASVREIATRVIVVDSGSQDDTVTLARGAGADVLHHAWTTHAAQFNWALAQIKDHAGWVLRLDADEVVTPALAAEIALGLPDVDGLYVKRRLRFMGQDVRFGGVFPIRIIRLFRNGCAHAEDRWMDEHIVVDGPTGTLRGAIIDDNRKPLDWWVAKHNAYASREVVDILTCRNAGHAVRGPKRWIKVHVYARLPKGLRAGAYFLYRYLLRLGFMDGARARSFHILQGFWYRYLVDAKLDEVERHITRTCTTPEQAIMDVLGIDVTRASR